MEEHLNSRLVRNATYKTSISLPTPNSNPQPTEQWNMTNQLITQLKTTDI